MIASSQPFSCFGRAQAMYSDPADCTMFYECVDGHPVYHRSCALTGTVFDQGDQICDWPANVPPPCGTEPVPVTTEAPPPPPFTCDDKPAGTYPDVTNCRKYWECVPGHPPYNRPCALEELVYNPDTGICDWPRDVVGPCGEQRKRTLNVTDENSGTDENSAGEETGFSCEGRADGLYSDPEDCAMYYECVASHPVYHRPCANHGTVFDEADQICDWPANVAPPCGTEGIFTCGGKAPGSYTDPNDCAKFYQCVVEHPDPFHFDCPAGGLVFDPEKKICEWPWTVAQPCGYKTD
ncbi:protein obstructor-E-like isoform X4 [Branchiostoma lanceolatum]|uniref:protein obstructor-E-like isoform X4 n=1 Tax=Branchiostoma lanceolatum TaxID=7740 RepID=UPI003453E416